MAKRLLSGPGGRLSGDKVASVTVGDDGVFCTYAHVCGAHIVAQIGNSTFDLPDQEKDFQLFADHPDVQEKVFDAFRQVGVVMAIALEVKRPLQGPGCKTSRARKTGLTAWSEGRRIFSARILCDSLALEVPHGTFGRKLTFAKSPKRYHIVYTERG